MTQLTPYQQYIVFSRYSRWRDDLKRRETWEEVVDRYTNYFSKRYGDVYPSKQINEFIKDLKVMPSMRCLMTAGPALERDNVAGFNCSYLAIDHPRAFDEILYLLMCFSPDTLVKTKNGSKKISELTLDDEVLSFDETTKRYEFIRPSQVVETPSSEREKIELTLADGPTICCTSDHRFLTENRGWVKAKDLTEEDDIKNWHEKMRIVKKQVVEDKRDYWEDRKSTRLNSSH